MYIFSSVGGCECGWVGVIVTDIHANNTVKCMFRDDFSEPLEHIAEALLAKKCEQCVDRSRIVVIEERLPGLGCAIVLDKYI